MVQKYSVGQVKRIQNDEFLYKYRRQAAIFIRLWNQQNEYLCDNNENNTNPPVETMC